MKNVALKVTPCVVANRPHKAKKYGTNDRKYQTEYIVIHLFGTPI